MSYYSVELSAHRDDTLTPMVLPGCDVPSSVRAHVGMDRSFVSRGGCEFGTADAAIGQ
jgi:hypothetical protein